MGITPNYLPGSAPIIDTAYQVALSLVLCDFACIDPFIYSLMVYNLAGDNLLNYAPDQFAVITGITWSGGMASATTAAPHGFATGDVLSISGCAPLGYNTQPGPANTFIGTPIIVTGATTFEYLIAANPGTFAQGGMASETYFATLRRQFNLTGFVSGVISASNDESTGQSILNPDFMKGLTLGNLQNLKTPYGRQYLAFAQDYGQIWGVS